MIFEEKKINILLIEDEDYDVRRVLNTIKPFEERMKILDIVSNGLAALELLKSKKGKIDLVIMDYQIAGGLMGENLILQIKDIDSSVQIIVITKMTINLSDYNFANKLIKAGAFGIVQNIPAILKIIFISQQILS